MSDTCPVVRILPSHPSQGDFVEINREDYDPAVHTLLDPVPAEEAVALDSAAAIPADWASMHWASRVKLAKALGAPADVTADQANEVIAAEVAKRASAEA